MLKLLIFAPCDKVILSDGGQTSLVGVMEEVHVSIVKDKEFGADAMIPYKWNVLTLWAREEDVPDAFTCHMQLIMLRPDGVKVLEAQAKFEVNNSFRNFRQNLELPVLPAGIEGEYPLTVWVKEGQEEWREVSTFKILIHHRFTDDPPITIVEPSSEAETKNAEVKQS